MSTAITKSYCETKDSFRSMTIERLPTKLNMKMSRTLLAKIYSYIHIRFLHITIYVLCIFQAWTNIRHANCEIGVSLIIWESTFSFQHPLGPIEYVVKSNKSRSYWKITRFLCYVTCHVQKSFEQSKVMR